MIVLGWREWLCLPELGIRAIKAKVDTGARSSALHALGIDEFEEAGRPMVRFVIEAEPNLWRRCQAPVIDWREVRDSGGHRTLRPFIRTPLLLAGQCYPIEINLTPRTDMLFPMLLGRTAMHGRFLVDPSASFLQGER